MLVRCCYDESELNADIRQNCQFTTNHRGQKICQCCGKAVKNNNGNDANGPILGKCLLILLKPSKGGFTSYTFGDDLHIGIFHPSTSLVTSFCQFGLVHESPESWAGAIPILEMPPGQRDFHAFLDLAKLQFTAKEYSPVDWNCLDFVLLFLRQHSLRFSEIFAEKFVTQYILPFITKKCVYEEGWEWRQFSHLNYAIKHFQPFFV